MSNLTVVKLKKKLKLLGSLYMGTTNKLIVRFNEPNPSDTQRERMPTEKKAGRRKRKREALFQQRIMILNIFITTDDSQKNS